MITAFILMGVCVLEKGELAMPKLVVRLQAGLPGTCPPREMGWLTSAMVKYLVIVHRGYNLFLISAYSSTEMFYV